MQLSTRSKYIQTQVPEYLQFVWSIPPEQLYNKHTNPSGLAVLTVAENVLTVDMLSRRMMSVPAIPQEVFMYGSSLELRTSLARLFERTFFNSRKLNANNIVLTNGAGPAINMLLFSICNPGDGVIVPTPYYPGFDLDLTALVHTTPLHAHMSGDDGFKFDITSVQRAYDKAKAENITARCILITSPTNPQGQIYTKDEIFSVWQWAVDNKIHLIMDELYALSCFDASQRFVSISDVLREHGKEFGHFVHVVWSFSKDFDASGFRVGAIYSENQELLGTLRDQSYFHFSSNLAQYYLSSILKDEEFIDKFISTNKKNLQNAYGVITSSLDKQGISYIPASAGFFVLLDFRKYLETLTHEAERVFWKKLIDEAKVVLVPGTAMHTQPGWFRCCYASCDSESLVVFIDRLGKYLRENCKIST